MTIKVSDRLKNGATVLAIKERPIREKIALCWWQSEYVSWAVDDLGNSWWGHYHGQNFEQAVKGFEER
jgi:hypothetical protein